MLERGEWFHVGGEGQSHIGGREEGSLTVAVQGWCPSWRWYTYR